VVIKAPGHLNLLAILPALVEGFDIVLFYIVPGSVFEPFVTVMSANHISLLISQC